MRKTTQALSEERAAEGLTKEQREATIQKWAEWILKQRESTAKGKPLEGPKPHNGSSD